MGERIRLFDTTLRDGAQTRGVSFSLADKIQIAEALDMLGVDYIEGGFPGANPVDDAFFSSPPQLARATFTAFGMTRRAGRSVEKRPGPPGGDGGADARGLPGRQGLGLTMSVSPSRSGRTRTSP